MRPPNKKPDNKKPLMSTRQMIALFGGAILIVCVRMTHDMNDDSNALIAAASQAAERINEKCDPADVSAMPASYEYKMLWESYTRDANVTVIAQKPDTQPMRPGALLVRMKIDYSQTSDPLYLDVRTHCTALQPPHP